MKIACENLEFEKDMQDLVNLFFDEEDCPFSIAHSLKEDEGKFVSTITFSDGEKGQEEIEIAQNLSELRKKSALKSAVKNHLYKMLSKRTNTKLPWGSLTGVRPTKFARELVERGEIKPHLVT